MRQNLLSEIQVVVDDSACFRVFLIEWIFRRWCNERLVNKGPGPPGYIAIHCALFRRPAMPRTHWMKL